MIKSQVCKHKFPTLHCCNKPSCQLQLSESPLKFWDLFLSPLDTDISHKNNKIRLSPSQYSPVLFIRLRGVRHVVVILLEVDGRPPEHAKFLQVALAILFQDQWTFHTARVVFFAGSFSDSVPRSRTHDVFPFGFWRILLSLMGLLVEPYEPNFDKFFAHLSSRFP